MGTDPTIILKTNVKKDSDTKPLQFLYENIPWMHGWAHKLFGSCQLSLSYQGRSILNPRGGNMQHWQIFFPLLLCCNKKEI